MLEKILILKVILIHFLCKFRLNILIFFLNNKFPYKKNLIEFKNTGITVIPNYFNEKQVGEMFNECMSELDKIPKNIEENVENYKLESGVRIEKIKGSIKLKSLELSNNRLKQLARKKLIDFFAIFYTYGVFKILKFIHALRHGSLLVYTLTHDGSFKHYAVQESYEKKQMIAGEPHIDTVLPSIKAFVALKKVNKENGPFIYYEKSNSLKVFKQFNMKLFLSEKGIKNENYNAHVIFEKYKRYCEENLKMYRGCVNLGDVVIFDTSSLHFASNLTAGERHILWLYY